MATLTITAVAACGTDADQAPAAVDAPVEGVRVTLVDAGEAMLMEMVGLARKARNMAAS